jgi:DNA-binding Xre family transcriptional regulator
MIVFKLDETLKSLNISRSKFSKLSGIRPNTINDMCNGNTKRIEICTLDALLSTLNEIGNKQFDVQDILTFEKNNRS